MREEKANNIRDVLSLPKINKTEKKRINENIDQIMEKILPEKEEQESSDEAIEEWKSSSRIMTSEDDINEAVLAEDESHLIKIGDLEPADLEKSSAILSS